MIDKNLNSLVGVQFCDMRDEVKALTCYRITEVKPLPQIPSHSHSVTAERYLSDKRSPVSHANALAQGQQEECSSFMWLKFAF